MLNLEHEAASQHVTATNSDLIILTVGMQVMRRRLRARRIHYRFLAH